MLLSVLPTHTAIYLIVATAVLAIVIGYVFGRNWLGKRFKEWYVKANELDKQNFELRSKISNYMSAGNDTGALKVKIAAIERENNQLELKLRMYREDIERLKTMIVSLENINNQLAAERKGGNNKGGNDTDLVKKLQLELFQLRTELASIKPETEPDKEFLGTLPFDEAETPEDEFTRISSRRSQIDFERIGYATEEDSDNLKQITGIGNNVARKLNYLGIYNFQQIANLTPEDMVKVNEAIEFFPGRILKDNWVGQAKKLLGKRGE
jgi:predicted flap endonuclease-1-like 5' DNA nuclease